MPKNTPSRIAFLRERLAAAQAAGGPTSDVPFRQASHDLIRIQVPVSFPLYNLTSGRTHRAQAEYVEDHELAEDFFADPESEAAQAAQHTILLEMVDQAELRQDLEENDQRRPLVLTYDGFVVDGNRRTAALRARGDIEQLTAIVLPEDALASDIYDTELELQMAVETKAEYNWVDEALHVRHGIVVLGEDKSSIARRMKRPAEDIDDLLGRLSLVDLYLDWLGAAGKYHRVGSVDEQSFIELHLRERRQKFSDLSEPHKRAVRNAVFAVVHSQGGYKAVRQVADSLIGQLGEVTRRVREEKLSPELVEALDLPPTLDTDPPAQNELLAELAGFEPKPADTPGVELLNILEAPPATDEVATVLMRVAEDLAELARERRDQEQPLRKIERALRALQDSTLSHETPRQEDISTMLSQIVSRAEELRCQLDTGPRPDGD
ncbi:MAG: hypothetical protein WAU69_15925 [Solirubrobacteraceae bacterium]